jgi:hypothetical protein
LSFISFSLHRYDLVDMFFCTMLHRICRNFLAIFLIYAQMLANWRLEERQVRTKIGLKAIAAMPPNSTIWDTVRAPSHVYAGRTSFPTLILTEIDEEARKRTEALQAEQMRFNKSTLRAAWIAAGAAIAGILVTVGLPYVQYRIAQPEIARHTAIRNGLQSLYEQGTGLLKEGIPLSNSVDSRGIWLT